MVLWIKYERKADTAFNNRGLFLGVITQGGLVKDNKDRRLPVFFSLNDAGPILQNKEMEAAARGGASA